MMIDLTDRTALVTGGGQGVGEAIALVLAQQGANVAIGDVLVDRAEEVAEEIRRRGRPLPRFSPGRFVTGFGPEGGCASGL